MEREHLGRSGHPEVGQHRAVVRDPGGQVVGLAPPAQHQCGQLVAPVLDDQPGREPRLDPHPPEVGPFPQLLGDLVAAQPRCRRRTTRRPRPAPATCGRAPRLPSEARRRSRSRRRPPGRRRPGRARRRRDGAGARTEARARGGGRGAPRRHRHRGMVAVEARQARRRPTDRGRHRDPGARRR